MYICIYVYVKGLAKFKGLAKIKEKYKFEKKGLYSVKILVRIEKVVFQQSVEKTMTFVFDKCTINVIPVTNPTQYTKLDK